MIFLRSEDFALMSSRSMEPSSRRSFGALRSGLTKGAWSIMEREIFQLGGRGMSAAMRSLFWILALIWASEKRPFWTARMMLVLDSGCTTFRTSELGFISPLAWSAEVWGRFDACGLAFWLPLDGPRGAGGWLRGGMA